MKIGIIGGTGVNDYSFVQNISTISVNTPYGKIEVLKGSHNENTIFFLNRHSKGHSLTPSLVNYKGNIYALKSLNVDYVIATAAVGAINNCSVGDFVVLNDFIDFTKNRSCTFFDTMDSGVVHIDMTSPYCETLRQVIINSIDKEHIPYSPKGTYICTEGPRFETPSEIRMYKLLGGDVVGMTNVPEVILAREACLCYATIALVTNYAAGISKTPLTQKEVTENMNIMGNNLQKVLINIIHSLPIEKICSCKNAVDELNSLK